MQKQVFYNFIIAFNYDCAFLYKQTQRKLFVFDTENKNFFILWVNAIMQKVNEFLLHN